MGSFARSLGFGKIKFAAPKPPTLSEITSEALGGFNQALTGVQAAGSRLFPEFANQQARILQQGRGLSESLRGAGGDALSSLFTDKIRAGQAARGLALSPVSALQEGQQATAFQAGLGQQALGIEQSLLGSISATPLALPSFGQLFGGAQQVAAQRFGSEQQSALARFQRKKSQQTARAKLTGLAVAGITGGIAGGAGLAGGAGGAGGAFTGFAQGAGFLPSNFGQSQVATTQGGSNVIPFDPTAPQPTPGFGPRRQGDSRNDPFSIPQLAN